MDPSDFLAGHPYGYAFPPDVRGTTPADKDLSYSQIVLSMRAVPFDPGEPDGRSYPLTKTIRGRLHHRWQFGHSRSA